MDNGIEKSLDKIVQVNLEDEMRKSFIDYAMSVIVARALPDVRDGLKPVQRRILYAMSELNLDPSKAHKKSARIVGDTMGKYHPHGESSIYDTMVRLAQDFTMRYMLVDGHGNFGSMDGDGAAAQRYTEARLSRIAVEMLADIEKDTVDFIPNYDGEFHEPTVMPARYPNLLVNGSSGIAVGMATNIPPHNLNEAIDAIVCIIDNHIQNQRETDIEELISIVRGPDFPTGATILGRNGIKQAYRTGRGKMLIRAVAGIEPMGHDREMIVVTELPYQVNKSRLLERIGELVKDKRIEGISDLRDESDRNGVRIVIELKRDTNANVILNQLYKFSSMQESYSMNMLALVNNEAKVLNLKDMLELYLEHQKEVVTRRTKFELEKAGKRAHILEGLLIALDNIDEVIRVIRSSPDGPTARVALTERFELSIEQAGAIVEMRLRSLTGLERDKLQQEYAELMALIQELTEILKDENRLYSVIREEILITKTKYGDPRRTQMIHNPGEIVLEDLIDEESCVITMTHLDYIKRLPLATYKSQNRGGKGIIGMQMRDEDLIKNLFVASTHEYILFFTSRGRVYRIKAYEIPEAGRTARGLAIVNLLALTPGEKITAVMPVKVLPEAILPEAEDASSVGSVQPELTTEQMEQDEFQSDIMQDDIYEEITADDEYLVMVTKMGVIKKTPLRKFANIKKAGLIALTIREDDELMVVLRTDGNNDIFVATSNGMGIRFKEKEIRPTGRTAAGVRAIDLAQSDYVVSAGIMSADNMDDSGEPARILLVSENGYGKCTENKEFKAQHRAGRGLKIYGVTAKTGHVLGVEPVTENEELMMINSEGIIIRIRVADISTYGRYAQGVKLINLAEGSTVVSFAKVAAEIITEQETEAELEQETEEEQEYDSDTNTEYE